MNNLLANMSIFDTEMPKPKTHLHKKDKAENKTDKLFIVHVLLCLTFVLSYRLRLLDYNTIGLLISNYFLALILFFYFFYYKKLNHTKTYICWFAIAMAQVVIYLRYRHEANFIVSHGIALTSLRGLVVFLLLYQSIRQLSLYFYHKEPVIMAKGVYDLTALEYITTPPLFMVSILSCVIH